MIKVTFLFGGSFIEVIIKGNDILFYDPSSNMTTTIEGLRLSKAGVLKEFPDLKREPDWRKKAATRFKDKIKEMKSETLKKEYIIRELQKQGYVPKMYQRGGHRPIRIK